MKRYVLRLLVLLNVALLLVFLLLWLRPDGSLRGVAWKPPAPHLTNFVGQLPILPSPAASDTANFVAMLERPLFAGNRRPPPLPPPPPAAVAEVPPDNLSTAKLTGIFNGTGTGGIIMSIAGKDKRLQLNQAVEGWTLKSISGRDVTFTKGAESRVLQLQRAGLTQTPAGVVPMPGAAGAAAAAAAPPGATAAPQNRPQSYPFSPAQAPSGGVAPAGASSADGSAATAGTSSLGGTSAGAAAPKPPPRAAFGGTRPKPAQ